MSLNAEWLDEKNSEDYCELLNVLRESGDGESKETSPHTSASEDDNHEAALALIDVNRKVERRKDKKVSKIPVRHAKLSHNANVTKSTYDINFYYEQLDFAETAKAFHKISDKSQIDSVKGKMEIDSVVDTFIFENCEVQEKTEVDSNDSVSISNVVESNELDLKKENSDNVDISNLFEIEGDILESGQTLELFQIKQSNIDHDSGMQKEKESEAIIDIVNTALVSDDPILEAPEEFRSLYDTSGFNASPCILNDESECNMKVNETFAMSLTDIGEPKPCRIVASSRDHDIVSKPEANMCGLALNKNIIKMSGHGIASHNEREEICMTNEVRKHEVIQLDGKLNANICIKSAAPSGTIEIICGAEDCQHVFTDINGGESKDNDQIQSDSINITEFDTETYVDECDFNSNNMVGVLSTCMDSCNNFEILQAELATGMCKKDHSSSMSDVKGADIEILSNNSLCNTRQLDSDSGCPEGRDSVNELHSSLLDNGANACAGNEQTLTAAVKPSIAIGVEWCAQAPRCSRISVATVCAASTLDSPILPTSTEKISHINNIVTEKYPNETPCVNKINLHNETATESNKKLNGAIRSESASVICDKKQDTHLIWTFKNGRLVFETSSNDESERGANKKSEQSSRPTDLLQCHLKSPDLFENVKICANNKCKRSQKSNNLCDDGNEVKSLLCSKDLNRRVVEGQSRLKHLENKLKEAGITDGKSVCTDFNGLEKDDVVYKHEDKSNDEKEEDILENLEEKEVKQVVGKLTQPLLKLNLNCDAPENFVCLNYEKSDFKSESTEDLLPEANGCGDQVDFAGGSLCEFDVRQVGTFSGLADSDFFVVYDELENSSDEDECEHEHYHIIKEMRGGGSMGADGERVKQHNPDRENLKSLLKKPGRGRDVKKNRVVFNENKNEFFDADYIILIREECDYDDEEDDGVCTCNDHEMVRLTCCEPNCNCNLYEGFSSDPTPQSPKFAPPLEFVDAVTLSPPEGYKDMELGEQQLLALQQMAIRGQRTAVCRDCSATHDDDGDGSMSDNEDHCENHSDPEDIKEEAEKTDQSQQTTPTTPSPGENESSNQQQYVLETVTMTTVTERKIMRELEDDQQRSISPSLSQVGSPISGILKGGRLWKQQSQDMNNIRNIELQRAVESSVTSDEESNGNKRSVRFTESNANKRDVCDGAPDQPEVENPKQDEPIAQKDSNIVNSSSPESTEMMLTFKLGNHILISNNSLKPNSAVRQLFPCSKPLSNKPGDNDSVHQYLVTAESLRAFEEAKRSKLPQIIQSDETDESIKRAIERNTLRRSLIRYEPRPKKKEQKADNSLVERIKQLTCDVDDATQDSENIQQRASPPGEEARKSPEVNSVNKSFSPSSSSTASSNSSSVSSTYKKITDLFAKREKQPDVQNSTLIEPNPNTKILNQLGPAPDLGNTGPHPQDYVLHHCPVTKSNSTNDTRKQFLSTLAPLTACVSSVGVDDHYYHISHHTGDRSSITSSVGTEYSLEDIDEGLKNEDDDAKRNAPDVVVGTPSASESGDELAMFVQQDASRIERIKKKYQQDTEDDEHDDYGFNKRPSVRGIKPRFGTTTEILQQIQNQMQPIQPGTKTTAHVAWPYYSEASLSALDNNKSRNINQNVPQYQYTYVTEEMKTKMYIQHYRPTTLIDDNIYQNCTNQRCNRDVAYKTNANLVHSPVMRIGGGCSELYHQAVPSKSRNGRPESPPPFDVARNVHQTMVYIPYNHIESYQPACVSPNPQYVGTEKCYARVVNQNQINRYAEPMYHNQPRLAHPPVVDVNVVKQISKPMMRLPYPLPNSQPQTHLVNSRSESPLPGQFSTARSTQTAAPPIATCNYYQTVTPRYRPMVGPIITHGGVTWNGESIYANKVNRHSFPAAIPRYPAPDNISLTDSESQYSGPIPNGFRQSMETTFPAQKDSLPNSPTKPRFIERGVPEGAASVSPQDSNSTAQNTSTMTSPTSPQNPPPTNPKPLFYAMNV